MPLLELPCLDNTADSFFPPTEQALENPNGLLAWGGTLNSGRLVSAYQHGIFPWFGDGEPILWWTPSPRCVLKPADIYISDRTLRRLRQPQYQLKADTAFSAVVEGCAAPGPGRMSTWITTEMKSAYRGLHEAGVAHSVEVWSDQKLIGGIYGLAIGHMFFGESMFSVRPDASKIAMIYLCRFLQDQGFGLMDCQVGNPHLYSMGAVDIEREEFEKKLALFTTRPRENGSWQTQFETDRCW